MHFPTLPEVSVSLQLNPENIQGHNFLGDDSAQNRQGVHDHLESDDHEDDKDKDSPSGANEEKDGNEGVW